MIVSKRIKLRRDLEVDPKHNCKKGNEYIANAVQGKSGKVEFTADSGEKVIAKFHEYDVIDYDVSRGRTKHRRKRHHSRPNKRKQRF